MEAQLTDILDDLTKGAFMDLLAIGETWRQEAIAAERESGLKGSAEVQQKWEGKLKEVKVMVERGEADDLTKIMEIHSANRALSEKLFSYYFQQYEIARDSVLHDRKLISADKAAEISWVTV